MRKNTSNFIDNFVSLKREVVQLKTSQLSGSGNVMSYVTETAKEWDFNWTAPSNQPFTLRAVFTAKNKIAAFTTFDMTFLANNVPLQNYTHNGAPIDPRYIPIQQLTGDKELSKFQSVMEIRSFVGSGWNVKLKVRVTSVDTGTLTVTNDKGV